MLNALNRLADAPKSGLSKMSARLAGAPPAAPTSHPTPEHVVTRLEDAFEMLSELPSQPHVAAAFDLVLDMLEADLPAEAMAAGLYDIDTDEIRILCARGAARELTRGSVLSRQRCFARGSTHGVNVTTGEADGADWLGGGGDGSTVLLCPILHDTNLFGLLALANPLCAAEFTPDDVELMGYVTEQLAAFIQTQRHSHTRMRAVRAT